MANDTVVSVVNTVLYGNSKKYPLEETSEETVVQWAVATKQLLLAHPELAKVKRLLDDSISPEAKLLYGRAPRSWRQCRKNTQAEA